MASQRVRNSTRRRRFHLTAFLRLIPIIQGYGNDREGTWSRVMSHRCFLMQCVGVSFDFVKKRKEKAK